MTTLEKLADRYINLQKQRDAIYIQGEDELEGIIASHQQRIISVLSAIGELSEFFKIVDAKREESWTL